MLGRNKIAMIMAEFVGTAVLTLVMLGVSRSSVGLPYFVALAAGLAVGGTTLALGAVSGAHFNPAVTIGMWSTRRIKTLPAIVYVAAQLLGAAAAYLLFTYFVNQTFKNSGHFTGRALVAEASGAFVLSLGWAAVVYHRLDGARAAAVSGLSYALGIMGTSVASLTVANPAVALGTRGWVWGTTVLGPILGALIGFNLYALLFAPLKTVAEPAVADEKLAGRPKTKK